MPALSRSSRAPSTLVRAVSSGRAVSRGLCSRTREGSESAPARSERAVSCSLPLMRSSPGGASAGRTREPRSGDKRLVLWMVVACPLA